MLTPADIVDAQVDLLWRLENEPLFRMFTAITAEQMVGGTQSWGSRTAPDSEPPLPKNMADVPNGEAWADALRIYVRTAYAYRVTHDMGALLEVAAASLDEEDQFDGTLAPTPMGIVYFEKPIKVDDLRGHQMLVHWAVWGPADTVGKPGLALSFFNDLYVQADSVWENFAVELEDLGSKEEREETYQNVRRAMGRWGSTHQMAAANGDPLGPSLVEAHQSQLEKLIALGEFTTTTEVKPATNLLRYMHALFLLLNQTIVQTEEEHVERHAAKRARRAGLPGRVTVVQLRRTQAARHEGESLIEWQHRWVVRGHWRWQYCGPHHPWAQEIEPGKYRARIWIHPYQKGPEDAPLMIPDKLYSLEK